MADDPDPYAVLGVLHSATTAEIRQRYHDLARAAHPDVVGDRGLAMMQRLNAAWDLLRNPVRRATYDAGHGIHRSSRPYATAGQATSSNASGSSTRPAWTGAAGAPPGSPSGSRLEFGLYHGWTLGEIARRDPGYLLWLVDRREGAPYAAEIRALLESIRPPAQESPRKRRWGR